MCSRLALVAMAMLFAVACGSASTPGDGGDPPVDRGAVCTDIGCESGVTFTLTRDLVTEEAYEVEACVGDLCRTATLEVPAPDDGPFAGVQEGALGLNTDADSVSLRLPEGDWSGTHRVSLLVRDSGGEVVAETERDADFERMQPNGPDCPPTCWRAEVAV